MAWTLYENRVTNELFPACCFAWWHILQTERLQSYPHHNHHSYQDPRLPLYFDPASSSAHFLSLYFTTIFTFQQLMIITTLSPYLSLPLEEPLIPLFRATLCNNGEKPSYSSSYWRGGYHFFSHCMTSFSLLFAFLVAEKTWENERILWFSICDLYSL